MSSLIEYLRPRSSEGEVYRDEWVEVLEPFYDGAAIGLAAFGVVMSAVQGEWLQGALIIVGMIAILLIARLAFFRPHLVVGSDLLLLVGVFHTRRLA